MIAGEAIGWFKRTFRTPIEAAVKDTPFSIDLMAAIAYQETGHIWSRLIEKLSVADLLKVCVGDTLDAPRRSAFPKTKADLLAAPEGAKMFAIARQALEDLARWDARYSKVAQRYPNKFCHGFGIFQYDLQFFRSDPSFFLSRKWHDFSTCLAVTIRELGSAMKRAYGAGKQTLTNTESVYVAIAYHRGSVNFGRGFKQGFRDGSGRYYGEYIDEFIHVSQKAGLGGGKPGMPEWAEKAAPLPPATPVTSDGAVFEVEVQSQLLRLRSEPKISSPAGANVIAQLPAGQLVIRIGGKSTSRFAEVETNLDGAYYRGFAASEFLKPAPPAAAVSLKSAEVTPPRGGIPAVYMPRKDGTKTLRTRPAGAHSLNEPGQPAGRGGTTARDRCAELGTVVQWLAVDRIAHLRYQPTPASTFCNIYAHDYCHLAGVYLPRVWWTPRAIERLARGESVRPLYGSTIDEQRANDLFRWLRDFGSRFGWRRTGSATKIQEAANLGGIGLIVARRRIEGRSGHIAVVVPETEEHRAKRDGHGEVTGPLQSQAGRTNFRYKAKGDWWRSSDFADSAFWIHA